MDENIRDSLRLMARPGETDDLVLQRPIRNISEEDLEEIIEAIWERLQSETGECPSGRGLI
ncbi:MAG: hypothetical protein GYA29_04570 [Methanothrix sp.]|nr:hypothetical protein [Methanothrix sp.]